MDQTSLAEYNDLLSSHRIPSEDKSTEITHTLMGGVRGKYNISGRAYERFVTLYEKVYMHVNQYVVERPTKTSFLFIDVDWHHKNGYDSRQYTIKHIKKIIKEVNDILLSNFEIQKYQLKAFVHEKNEPTCEIKNYKGKSQTKTYKDGFHIFYPDVPLSFEHRYFVIDKLSEISKLKNVFKGIKYSNSYDKIFDTSIVMANGILMYGSCKEGRAPYFVTKIFDYDLKEQPLEEYEHHELLHMMLNRRYLDDDNFPLKNNLDDEEMEDIEERYKKHLTQREKEILNIVEKKHDYFNDDDSNSDNCSDDGDYSDAEHNVSEAHNNKKSSNTNSKYNCDDDEGDHDDDVKPMKQRDLVFDDSKSDHRDIEIAKKLTELFSAKRATEHDDWMNVGFALHNISKSLFKTFVTFSKKTKRDNYSYDGCKKLWDCARQNNYTLAAFYRWAREDSSPEKFKKVLREIVNPLIKKAISGTHDDIANMVHAVYRDRYKCVSIANDVWFEFQNNKWVMIESAYTLSEKISSEIADEFMRYHSVLARQNIEEVGVDRDDNMNKIKKMVRIHDNLKNNGFVNSVKAFCARKFFDPKFEQKLNDNYDLIGFENGVFDLSTMSFRKGTPDDYVTFTTGYDYTEYDEDDPIFKDIMGYFKKVQMDEVMMNYLLEFIASCMRGLPDQHFHFWTGSGSNGKSTTIDMVKKLMGDYFGVLPITVLTRKRNGSSGPTPELSDKNGKRLLVLQEPEHTDVIYVGQMKELTGTDTIYARGMYEKKGFEYVPQFKMVMPCNNLPAIPARDGGTWRRIRATPWESEFVDGKPEEPYQFKKDKSLPLKFDKWKEPLMWLILNKYFKAFKANDYEIFEPDKVMEATKKYKKDSDIFFDFIVQYIDETNNKEDAEPVNLIYSLFRKWYNECYSEKSPPRKDLINYFETNMKKWKMDSNNIYGIKVKI